MKKTLIANIFAIFCAFSILAQKVNIESPPVEPVFSIDEGFYAHKLKLEIYSPAEDAKIYYTIDGKDPYVTKKYLYRYPISIKKTTVVKAIAVKGKTESDIFAHTYFINEPSTDFPTVSISVSPEVLFHPKTGLFVKGDNVDEESFFKTGANFWTRSEVTINAEIFEPSGKCVFGSNAGLRLFGGVSRLFPQKSLVIVADSKYGQKEINYPIFGKKGTKKFKFLVLRNSGSDFGRSHFRDAFMTALAEDMNVDRQDSQPAHVYINGKYWGIFNIREKINRFFIDSYHKIDNDSIDLLEHRMTRKRGSVKHYLRMIKFLEKNDLSDDANFAYLNTLMDVDNFMDYQIAQIYFDNNDAGGNIKFWRPQTEEGRWRWVLFDTDWGFGMHDEKAYRHNALSFHTEPHGPAWPNPPWSTFILRKLLENKTFEKEFINRFADYLNTVFNEQRVDDLLNEFYLKYLPEMPRHLKRWKLSEKTWKKHVKRMRRFGQRRPEYVRKHLAKKFNAGELRTLNLSAKGEGYVLLNNNIKIRNRKSSGIYFENVPIEIAAIPDIGYRFSHWDGVEMQDNQLKLTLLLSDSTYNITAVFEKYDHPLEGKIMFNEISCNDRGAGDWVEIYNFSDVEVNMHNWKFYDLKNEFIFPDFTLAPKDYAILCENQEKFLNCYPTSYNLLGNLDFGLNKRKEQMRLFTPKGAFIDSIYYELPPLDTSYTLNLLLPNLNNANLENWEVLEGKGSPNSANSYYVESTLQQKRKLWTQIGLALIVLITSIVLLVFRSKGKL